MPTAAIWWLRRDLRLADNVALKAAVQAEHVLPVFILDPALLSGPTFSARRYAFLLDGLQRLDADLRTRGSRLIIRRGPPLDELTRLAAESQADMIHAEENYTPYARRRDDVIGRILPLHLHPGLNVRLPDQVRKSDGTPYTVFTPFSRAWMALPLPQDNDVYPAPARLNTPPDIDSLPIPAPPPQTAESPFPAGAAEAQRRLHHFARHPIYQYKALRDRLDVAGTSTLSPYLRFGMLSARQAVVTALAARSASPDSEAATGAQSWLNELIWREFYHHILYHFPHVRGGNFRTDYDLVPWRNDPDDWEAWRTGQTGYPVIDAAMRQLKTTGWMHNRARMLVAAFLTKDLLIDWRWGERWFMQQLVDGDLAANNGGWQWSAGTGTDAAPYFRIFNPVIQAQKFDPEGRFIHRWLPELARVPLTYLHAPWTMPAAVQEQAGCRIGRDYPNPVVDHQRARERALTAYKFAKPDLAA